MVTRAIIPYVPISISVSLGSCTQENRKGTFLSLLPSQALFYHCPVCGNKRMGRSPTSLASSQTQAGNNKWGDDWLDATHRIMSINRLCFFLLPRFTTVLLYTQRGLEFNAADGWTLPWRTREPAQIETIYLAPQVSRDDFLYKDPWVFRCFYRCSLFSPSSSLKFTRTYTSDIFPTAIFNYTLINIFINKMAGTNGNGSNGNGAKVGTSRVKMGLAQMLKGGVIVSNDAYSQVPSIFMSRETDLRGSGKWLCKEKRMNCLRDSRILSNGECLLWLPNCS